jgi:hypothetical protein
MKHYKKYVHLTHFSSVNTNQSHKNVTHTIHASMVFPIIITNTANSSYMLGYPYCEQVTLSVPANEPVKPP